ncbi:choice-of-anchor Q domain-containing protein [Wenzhouxiangella sediminis]|nr:choice-of-anchor Q domain-containing protein [Wenzhouxiangella sediminis]
MTNADCDEVWIAEGVYKPVVPADAQNVTPAERATSFELVRPVRLYGGFSGDETDVDQRDPAAHVTVLSGDIDDNDTVDSRGVTAHFSDIVGSNTTHVLRAVFGGVASPAGPDTLIDGLTVTAGTTVNFQPGGGFQCYPPSVVLFAGPVCSFRMSRVIFQGNRSSDAGGGLAVVVLTSGVANPDLVNVRFIGNRAVSSGGGLFLRASSGSVLTGSISRATFRGNEAGDEGGGLSLRASGAFAAPEITNTTFFGNSTSGFGGAIATYVSGETGGTIPETSGAEPYLTNVTVSGNHAESGGGAISIQNFNSETLARGGVFNRMIIWGNTATSGPAGFQFRNDPLRMTVTNSVVQGSCPNNCYEAVSGDPMLGPPQSSPAFGTVLLPGANGAAVDAASCIFANDQRGQPRPSGVSCDLGAVELTPQELQEVFKDRFQAEG